MKKNVYFGEYDAYRDFDLIRTGMTLGTPIIKEKTIDIEGGDGELDLTEYFGDVNYGPCQLSFEFKTAKTQEEYNEVFSRIKTALHGRRMKVWPSEETDFHYIGRITVNEWKSDVAIASVVIDVKADPFKYKNLPTVISKTINGTETVNYTNSRRKVEPKITVTAATTITFKNITLSLSPGTYTHPAILFTEGDNVLTITTSGTVTVEYQEGQL